MAKTKRRQILMGLVLLFALVFPLGYGSPYILNTLIIMLIFMIYASAWNLLALSGQGSLGHAAFFGIGGYASAIIARNMGLPVPATILVGAVFAAGFGLLIGITCVRLKEWFLAMVTFGFAVIAHTITAEFRSVTGGWDGLPVQKILPVTMENYQLYEYYIVLLVAIAVIYVISRIMRLRMYLAFEAIRENELEAKVMGVNVTKYKLIAFIVSAFLAGMAGALEAHHIGYITPEVYGLEISFWPIIYCISGGLLTLWGPIIGTAAITVIWEALKLFGWSYERFVVIGIILILNVIFLPKGFISLPEKIRARFSSRQTPR
jgi:branched-chain amino acid transport system permease protein